MLLYTSRLAPTSIHPCAISNIRNCFTLPKILNIDKLLYLKDVTVEICPFEYITGVGYEGYEVDLYGEEDDVEDYVTRDFLRLTNACTTIDQLQQFVSQLPSDLEILKIGIYGFVRPKLDNYYACYPDKLSFKKKKNALQTWNILSGIRSLDVNLETYGESVSYFFSHFISKLTSLLDLSIEIDLHLVMMIFGRLYGCSSLGVKFMILYLMTTNWREQISSMQKRVCVAQAGYSKVGSIYSHFDCDEESNLELINLYMPTSHVTCHMCYDL
ncbi:unnamed protein product [Ambrosiozyma monospora]|uniref:Unnamed protein product n=1 Tax=Ambrosiozyma monospora TaxID=43982 RepID=A0A9W6YW31_AMBMO|nr:unnamed protein product [Ambrosiozyma monospora]